MIKKSQQMQIGSLGLLYCSETSALTTPFIVYSIPDPEKEITNVWDGTWVLPFKINALGNPDKQLPKDEAKRLLSIFQREGSTNIGHVLNLQPATAFVPSEISQEDWKVIIERLAV